MLAAIELLDYRPNPLARGLSLGRCQTIGVIVPFFTHASAVERLRGVVDALRGSRYDLVLFNVESPVHRDEHFASLGGRDRADGLVVMSLPPPPEHLARLRAAGVPMVLVDTTGEGVPTFVTDDIEGGRLATQHLVDLGHRDIAFVGDVPDNSFGFTSSALRQAGYRQVLAASGIRPRRGYVRHGPHERETGRKHGTQLFRLRDPPTAVFAASDIQALGVLEAAKACGLRVPHDVSVVGFDDIEISAYVGLTTVRQPLFESGRLAAKALLEGLDDEHALPAEEHLLPLTLVERSTTAPPPRRRAGGT